MNRASSLRNPLSSALRLAAFFAWTATLASAWLALRLFLRGNSKVTWAASFTARWGRGALRILGVRVRMRGTPPSPPFLLTANHLGYLDVAVLAASAPCGFVAKSEVAGWPVFGQLAAWTGTLFVNRRVASDAVRVNRLIAARLRDGGSLTLFPEGTSTAGALLPFHAPLLQHPAAAGMPVHYAALHYRAPSDLPPAAEIMCWWGEMAFLPHFLNLFRWKGMEAEVRFCPAPVCETDRKALSARLHDGVRALLRTGARAAPAAAEAPVPGAETGVYEETRS